MARAFIGLGSNLGDRFLSLCRAIHLIAQFPKSSLKNVSGVYQTEPVGKIDQPDFLNAVIEIDSHYPATQLLASLLDVETQLGRTRDVKWGPRIIDLDILSIEAVTHNTADLKVPHSELANRRFVLVPFAEIAADYFVLGFERTVQQLLEACSDHSQVVLYFTSGEIKKKLEEVASWEPHSTSA